MSNLDDFKVEELEQRLEMKSWFGRTVSVGADPCIHGNTEDFGGNPVDCN